MRKSTTSEANPVRNSPEATTVEFVIDKKKVLNSNQRMMDIVKSKYVRALRDIAGNHGMTFHPEEHQEDIMLSLADKAAQKRFDIAKRKEKKRLMTVEKLSAARAGQQAEENLSHLVPYVSPVIVPYLFDQVVIKVTVCPPTNRSVDPPNLYPTVKPLIDGMTDAFFWEDDNFKHITELGFRYGGPSGVKDCFKFVFDIVPV